jgi:hypothetical protein
MMLSGDPFGAIAGSAEVLRVGMDKTAKTAEILNASFLTTAQKQQAIGHEFVPFAKSIHALNDAISGVADAMHRMEVNANRAINMMDAVHQRDTARAQMQHQLITYQTTAQAGSQFGLRRGEAYDPMTYRGEVQTREQDIRLRAQDAVVVAQRQLAGGEAALARQRVAEAAASRQSDAAQRTLRRAEREHVDLIADQNRPAGNWWQRMSLSSQRTFGTGVAPHERLARMGAVQFERMAGTAADNATMRLQQERGELQRREVDLAERRNQLARATVEILQAELQILQMRNQRMGEDTRRLGGLSRGEYRQAQRAAELLRHRGPESIDRLSPELLRRAGLIDPTLLADMQRSLGQRRAQEEARAGTRVGSQFLEDWQRGAGSLGDTVARERQLQQTIRQELDDISVRSAHQMSAVFERTMAGMVAVLTQQMQNMIASFERQIRAINVR